MPGAEAAQPAAKKPESERWETEDPRRFETDETGWEESEKWDTER